MGDAEFRPAGPGRSPSRHFVFAPGDLAARNRSHFYFASLGVFLLSAYFLQGLIGAVLVAWGAQDPAIQRVVETLKKGILQVPWDWFFALIGVSFLAYILSLAFALRVVHARALRTVLTDRSRFDWSRVARGFLLYAALLAGPFLLYLLTSPQPPPVHFEPTAFLKLMLISSAALIIQTSAEEMVFRGYLMQFMASFTASPLFIIGVPSLLFALAHLGNPELAADPGVFGFYLGFGVFMGFIAVRDRSLELTIGAHFANNLITAVLVRTQDSVFQTPTLFVLPAPNPMDQAPIWAPILVPSLAPILFFLITSLVMRRR
jgi:hypothetical protein